MRIGSVSLSLLLATAVALTGNGLLTTSIAVRLADAGVAETTSGWILAAYYAGLTAGTLLLGSTVRRVGSVRAFTAFVAVGVASALAHAFLPAGWAWAPLRAFTGLSMAGVYMTMESWLNADAEPDQRGRVMAAYLVAIYLGTGAGQLLLPLWPAASFEALAIAALATSLAAIPVSLTRTQQPDLARSEHLPVLELLRMAPLGFGATAISGFVSATIYTNVPLDSRAAGMSAADISQLMAAFVIGGLAGQWPIGWLSDRTDRRRVVLLVAGLLALCCAAFLQLEESQRVLRLWLAALFGALAFSIYPLGVAHTLDRVGQGQSLAAAGQMLLASSLGSIAGPIVAAASSSYFGPFAFYALNGGLLTALAVGVLWRLIRVAPGEQEHFLAVPRTGQGVNELDPRTDPTDGDES